MCAMRESALGRTIVVHRPRKWNQKGAPLEVLSALGQGDAAIKLAALAG